MRTVKLICVAIDTKGTGNSNKYYDMVENSDGSINVEYGRVGSTKQTEFYPAGKKSFDSIVKSKLKKGYRDVTELKAVENSSSSTQGDIFTGITEQKVVKLMKFLLESSSNMVKTNYLITTDNVTKKQIEEAQSIINDTVQFLIKGGSVTRINENLIKLYTVLPRKMKNVKEYLLSTLSSDNDLDSARKLIDSEQSLLSTLESQVLSSIQTSETIESGKNILSEMGLEISLETDEKMLEKINFFLGENKQYMKNIYKVVNTFTQNRFENHVRNMSNKETALLWHGSRNCNWIGILQKGLMIRPTNAIATGSMFADGCYFANRSQKSLGYSSLSGSYWTKGNETTGFLALFSVHTGRKLDIYKHDSSCYSLDKRVKKEGYDSVFAHKGADLKNDEIITYDVEKSTISYLIEMGK